VTDGQWRFQLQAIAGIEWHCQADEAMELTDGIGPAFTLGWNSS
jgi:hypothetical protein